MVRDTVTSPVFGLRHVHSVVVDIASRKLAMFSTKDGWKYRGGGLGLGVQVWGQVCWGSTPLNGFPPTHSCMRSIRRVTDWIVL